MKNPLSSGFMIATTRVYRHGFSMGMAVVNFNVAVVCFGTFVWTSIVINTVYCDWPAIVPGRLCTAGVATAVTAAVLAAVVTAVAAAIMI